jgi:Flp pilus assembly protein TadG
MLQEDEMKVGVVRVARQTGRAAQEERSTTNLRPVRRRVRGRRQGQALLELTLVTPFLFMLILLAINFGGWLYAWTQVGNAARAVANYAVLGNASAGSPISPKQAAITSLIATDLASLPNYSTTNPSVAVCWNSNGTVQTITGTCSSPAADPEPASYIAVSVDLTFTFTPFFPVFSFPNLGISLPTLPTSIHRRIVMRYI